MLLIESGQWRLWCNPDNGAEWLAAQIRRQDQWHSIIPDCRAQMPGNASSDAARAAAGQDSEAPLPAGNFLMLPYSNRIRDGRFEFCGRQIQLAEADQHAIHGALRELPWQLVDHDASSVHCRIRSEDHPGVNWPWRIEADAIHQVEGKRLVSTLELKNLDSTPMPAGLGWHPYFTRHIEGASPRLTLPVNGVFPDTSGDCLPDGPSIELPDSLDFRTARTLDPDQRIDCCLSGLDGTCLLEWPDAGISLHMTASDICNYLVLYNPDMPHFAVEPVSNATDAFNLASRGIDSGLQVLEPGEQMQASMTLDLEIR